MAALTVMILVEMCEAVFSPAMAVPGLVLARAVPLAVLMVSAVRVLFHHPPHLPPLGSISIRMLQFITALWLAAAVGVVLTSTPFTPQLVPHQDFLFGYLPIIGFALAFKIQKNSLESTPPHEGAYTMAALTVMILVEMCEAVFSPAMAVPGLVLARAVPLAVLRIPGMFPLKRASKPSPSALSLCL